MHYSPKYTVIPLENWIQFKCLRITSDQTTKEYAHTRPKQTLRNQKCAKTGMDQFGAHVQRLKKCNMHGAPVNSRWPMNVHLHCDHQQTTSRYQAKTDYLLRRLVSKFGWNRC